MPALPECLKYVDNLHFHSADDIWFDATRAAAGVVFSARNRCITQNVSTASHKCVYATKGFAAGSGSHYMQFKVLNRGPNGYIMIGISDGTSLCTTSFFPGYSNCPGCSLYLANGHRYYGNTNAALASGAVTATTIGMLYNSDHKTLSFFADGALLGMAAGVDVLKAATYYPVVSLYELGHEVAIDDIAGAGQRPQSVAP